MMNLNGTTVTASIDARVELLCVIFRLAGNHEYCQSCRTGYPKGVVLTSAYAKDTDKHFEPFRDHQAIQFAKILSTQGISFDGPMRLAIYLNNLTELKERIPIPPRPANCNIGSRWQPDNVAKFLKLTRRFIKETDFINFFRIHQPLYDMATNRAIISLENAHLEWLDHFYGARTGKRNLLILAMLNGPSCYGVQFQGDGMEEFYCIMGIWKCDDSGKPDFDRSNLPTIIHEFGHSYVNPLVYAHVADLEPSGIRIYSSGKVAERMKSQAHGHWISMICESLVNATAVRYLHATRGQEIAKQQMQRDIECYGYLWMDELVQLFAQYEARRDQYPTFDSFMHCIIEFFNDYSKRMG